MTGKVTIHQEPNGRCTGVELDGQKLPHVHGYTISQTVNDLQLVTVTFVATAEIIPNRPTAPGKASGGYTGGGGILPVSGLSINVQPGPTIAAGVLPSQRDTRLLS